MSTTDSVTVIENGAFTTFQLNRTRLLMLFQQSPAAMVERFRNQRWTFNDCMSVFMVSSCSSGSAFDYYQSQSRKNAPPARLGLLAGTILTAALYGLPEADATIDFDKIEAE